jgi:hypothetical protein
LSVPRPNFSPFPFDRLRRLTRREAAIESSLARWLGPGRLGAKLAALIGGPVRARLTGAVAEPALHPDPHAAVAEVRAAGAVFVVAGAARPVRALTQRVLGGPSELDAPRPLTAVEQAVWALAVAAALADLGIAGEAWPFAAAAGPGVTIGFVLELPASLGGQAMTVCVRGPADLVLRAPPARSARNWRFDLPIVVGRCALLRASAARLGVGDAITIDPCLDLDLTTGVIGLLAPPGAVEARVATEYVPRDMAQPDDAMLEVTVSLGTTRLSLRQLAELALGQVVALGRPLSGPYEVRAAGRLVGEGELVDIDGELGVRIVSIAESPQ